MYIVAAMNQSRTSSSSHLRPGRIAAPRRTMGSLLGLLVATGLLLAPAVAQADNASTLTVVGTSDVVDSGLIANVIQPGFERAFPQYTMNYVSKGTGAAITYAEAGTASALVVHAASLENQFVAGGYSDERFGRAIFYGDYVLLGPPSDPAGVMTTAPHDIVTAFQDIAAAAANGKADFVSRGGTPGTTVEEHNIWALTGGPGSLSLCTVSAANGGGSSPSTAGGACPSTISYPSWYHVTGLTQGPNVIAADTCNFTNASNNSGNDCYVLTDRGAFQYLIHQAALRTMKIVTRNNSATAKGGQDLLVNSFHAYAINPAKFAGSSNVQINLPAAQAFLNYVTSPGVQAALKNYLGAGGDPPFIADASPILTATGLPKVAAAGRKVTITGTVINAVPGTPPLAGKTVTVSRVGSGLPIGVPVASGRTDSTGKYRIAFVPLASGSYQVSTGQITQIESSTLNPVFGDLLQPAAGTAVKLTVRSAVSRLTVNPAPGGAAVVGSVLPSSGHAKGKVTVLARRRGSRNAFRIVASAGLAGPQGSFAIATKLATGQWQLKASFQDAGVVVASTSAAANVTVAAAPTSFKVRKLQASNGSLTLTGSISPPAANRGRVVVLGLTTSTVGLNGSHATRGDAVGLSRIGTASVAKGASTFTVRAKLRRGYRWVLELEYVSAGQSASFSRLKALAVH